MQEVRKSQNQDLEASLAWSINSEKIISSSSSGPKGSEILCPSGVGTFHRLDSSLLMSLVDSRPLVLCAPFFTSCEAMEFAKTGHRQEECPDLPVSLLLVDVPRLGARVREVDGIDNSSHRSCFFCSS